MPQFISDTEWHELFNKTPKDGPLHLLLSMAEAWMDRMEEVGVTRYNEALKSVPQIEMLSAGDLAELFVICFQYWKQGERLAELTSVVETQLIKENLTIKMSTLSQIAQDQGVRQLYPE